MTAEFNSHLSWRPVSTNSVWWELHKSNIHDRAGIAKLLITENNVEMWKRWCDYHKTWTSDDWKYVIWSDELSFTLFPTSGRVYVWRTPKESHNPECETWRWIYDDLGSNILVFCSSYNYSEWLNYCNDYVDTLGNQLHPTVQTLFPNNNAIFQDDNSPIHTAGSVQSWFEEHEGALQHLPWPTQLPDLNIIKPLWLFIE